MKPSTPKIEILICNTTPQLGVKPSTLKIEILLLL
jgi:hypothetical protein